MESDFVRRNPSGILRPSGMHFRLSQTCKLYADEMAGGSSGSQKPEPTSSSGEQKHVQLLVVEDNDSTLKMLVRVIQRAGISFESAPSLDDAFSKLDAMKECRVLLTDFFLNEDQSVNSIPLIQKAKERGIYVILMSGTMEEALEMGAVADDYVQKPFDVIKLSDKVKAALDRNSH